MCDIHTWVGALKRTVYVSVQWNRVRNYDYHGNDDHAGASRTDVSRIRRLKTPISAKSEHICICVIGTLTPSITAAHTAHSNIFHWYLLG